MQTRCNLAHTCFITLITIAGSTAAEAQTDSPTSLTNSDRRASTPSNTADGYVGASIGQTFHDLSNCTPGASCDDTSTGLKAFVGGRFNTNWGIELGYVRLGNLDRNNGELRAQGANLGLVGYLPIGERASVLGKLGALYSWTHSTSNIAGVATGYESGLGLSYGLGIQWNFTDSWALRGDWDRYRIKFSAERESADMISIGMVVKF